MESQEYKVKEIEAKSIIVSSHLPDADFVVNPYTGCIHGCLYCYARFMKRFTGVKAEWGKFLNVKTNAPLLIPSNGNRYKGKRLLLSSVTDPYLPAEEKYTLTRQVIEKLVPLEPHLCVLTKSALVTRDIDLFKKFEECEVGLSITSNDDLVLEKIEPCSSSFTKRVEALRLLKENGIKTYAFIGPILPFLTDWKDIIAQLRGVVDVFWFEDLNLRGVVKQKIRAFIEAEYSYLLSEYDEIFAEPKPFWEGMEQEIKTFCEFEKINYKIMFHHREIKKS